MQTFEQRLSKELLKVTSRAILGILFLFSIVLMGINFFSYRKVIDTNYNSMSNLVESLDKNNVEMISKLEKVILSEESFGSTSQNIFMEEFYALNSQSKIPSNVILLDENNDIYLTTFAKYQINDHMKLFLNFFNESLDEGILYRGYSYSKDVSYLMSGHKTQNNMTIVLMQPTEKINELLMKDNITGVIVDEYNRIIASSNIIFGSRSDNKFVLNDGTFNGDKYTHKTVDSSEINLIGYSLVKHNSLTAQLIIGLTMLLLFYFVVIFFFKKSLKTIANKQLSSFNKLMKEINIVTEEDIAHKLDTQSGDEFELIAHEINEMNDTIRELTANNAELQFRSKVSELKRLEAQFDPHFLYNTLDVIRYTSTVDSKVTSDIIVKLTKILRYSIDDKDVSVSLKSDLGYIKMYCELQKYRFQDNFNYEINVEEECLNVQVPKLFVQPLIENSIKNSFINKATANVSLNIFMKDEFMVIEVEDDGIGIKDQQLDDLMNSLSDQKQLENHHGLYNTYRRIQLIYGERCTIHIESEYEVGTKVFLILDLSGKVEK